MATDYDRLLIAAEEIKGWLTPSEVATGLTRGGYEVTPQKLTNWKSRGISKEGLLSAAPILGCRIDWLKTGEGSMRDSAHHQPDASQIGTPKRTMIDIMDELSEQIAKADPSVRDEIARLVMSYIDKPEGKSRIAQAIKALLSDHADSGV